MEEGGRAERGQLFVLNQLSIKTVAENKYF